MNKSTLFVSQHDPDLAVIDEICAAGEPWVHLIKRGQTFRIVDLEGNQAVDTLFYNAHDALERYSATDTINRQKKLYLTSGSKLYSNSGNVMLTITADSAGDLKYHSGHSKAGDYVELSFVMNTLVILSTAPHPLDPVKPYQPGAVNLELFDTPPDATNECLHIAENIRALQNAQRFYCEGEK